MKDEKVRKVIAEFAEEHGLDPVVLFDDQAYDRSIVGITLDGRAVYNYDSMIDEYREDEQCSEEDALEWVNYNTIRALPYAGPQGPVVMVSTDILNTLYGEEELK